jgi:hypothetical protein
MSSEETISQATAKAEEISKWVSVKEAMGTAFDGFFNGILGNIFGFLIPTLFTIIFAILKGIALVLYYIFVKIVPFMVVYFGIPLFILGAMMALLFVGGHMFFLIAFFVGVFFYIKGVFNIKLKPPGLSAEVEATL